MIGRRMVRWFFNDHIHIHTHTHWIEGQVRNGETVYVPSFSYRARESLRNQRAARARLRGGCPSSNRRVQSCTDCYSPLLSRQWYSRVAPRSPLARLDNDIPVCFGNQSSADGISLFPRLLFPPFNEVMRNRKITYMSARLRISRWTVFFFFF